MHEDTNGVIKSKNRQRQNRKEKKGHTIKYETIHVKRKIRGVSRYTGMSSCFTSGTHRVILARNPVICHELEKDRNISVVICDTAIP
jgi:hypothetical protein